MNDEHKLNFRDLLLVFCREKKAIGLIHEGQPEPDVPLYGIIENVGMDYICFSLSVKKIVYIPFNKIQMVF